jgi:hypothetical protein
MFLIQNVFSQTDDKLLELEKSLPKYWILQLNDSALMISDTSKSPFLTITLPRYTMDSSSVIKSLQKLDSLSIIIKGDLKKCEVEMCDFTFIQYSSIWRLKRALGKEERKMRRRQRRCQDYDNAVNEYQKIASQTPTYFSSHYAFGRPTMNYRDIYLCPNPMLFPHSDVEIERLKTVEKALDVALRYNLQY